MPDVIYILINEAMPGFVKVGRTATSVEQRMKELDNTSMPLPFECFHAAEVPSGVTVERLLHAAFKDKRIRKRREFFKIDPEQVRSALLLAQTKDVTPRDDVFEEVEDVEALNKARNRRGGFSFEDVDIPIGSKLTFSKDDNFICIVRANNKVEFEGDVSSLSKTALDVLHRLGYNWKAVAGPDYWQFEDETLTARRLRFEDDARNDENL